MKIKILSADFFLCTSICSLALSFDECCPDQQCCRTSWKDNFAWWKKNTEFSLELDDHNKPKWGIESLLPIYQTPCSLRHTYFIQGRAVHRGSDDTYNVGLGYRYLGCCQDWLLGANTFFDSTRKHCHQRLGAGVEAMYRQFTLRANYYHPTTGKKTVKSSSGVRTTEEALKGWDAELETPFPYLPWMRVGINRYEWDGDYFNNIHGFKGTVFMNITDNIQVEAGRSVDNKFHNNFIKFSFTLGRPCEVEYTLFKNPCSQKAFVCRYLGNWTLAKVKRHNDVVIERVEHGAVSSGVIIGRGD